MLDHRPPRKLTAAEYLMLDNMAAVKCEFFQGVRFAPFEESTAHNAIRDNLAVELGGRLLGRPSRVYSGSQRVQVPSGLYTYPDITVVRGKPRLDPLDENTVINPKVLFEVISPASAEYDRETKSDHYKGVYGLAQMVLVVEQSVWAEVYSRQPDGRWEVAFLDDPLGELELTSLGVRIPLADLYRDVGLSDQPVIRSHTPDGLA